MAPSSLDLSLYVHVPFCSDKCLYCDFYSVPRRSVSNSLMEQVLAQTLEQARVVLEAIGPERKVSTIFMGGGTPSVLDKHHLRRLLEFFQATGCSEWTVEANPESINEQFLRVCAEAGVTRLSLGVQSLHDAHLRLLRRSADRAATLGGLDLAARHWRGELNLDFIAGIPGQTPDEVRKDLSVLDVVSPGHVSLYQLTCEPGTPLASLVDSGRIALDPPERQEALWFAGRDELLRRGYRQYEVSNFCLPGKECQHNLRYWRIEPYAGFGPGAVSTLPAEVASRFLPGTGSPGDIVRLTNPPNLLSFVRGRETLWGITVENVTPRDFLMESLMMGLRVDVGIDSSGFSRRFGAGLQSLLPGLWEKWQAGGHADPVGESYRLAAQGRLLLDALLVEASDALSDEAASRLKVTWP